MFTSKNIFHIFGRELAAYFKSAIGYTFIIVFLLMSVGLFMMSFFAAPKADMRAFFAYIPFFLCVLAPAVTMRLWAEDKKENTFEMLMTFPMRGGEIVLGKFLAALAFWALTLAATFTLPLMLAVLGDPDGGVIFSSYLGSLLLGSLFMALGLFFSGFSKDQIVAFVLSLLACFFVYLAGSDLVSAYLDNLASGLGGFLADVLGVGVHFTPFLKGVVELADVLYFLAWTAVFVGLNALYVEGRRRVGSGPFMAAMIVVLVGVGLSFNWLVAGRTLLRLDLSEGRVNTLSSASLEILSRLDVPVQLKYYVTPASQMPTALRNLEQGVIDRLEEMRVASGGRIEYRAVHMEAANALGGGEGPSEKAEDESLEKRLLDKGVKPFSVRAMAADEVTSKLIYSTIGVAYREKPERLIGQVVPQTLPSLEYLLISAIHKAARESIPKAAVVAPRQDYRLDARLKEYYRQMGQEPPLTPDPYPYLTQLLEQEGYEVSRIDLSQAEPLPEDAGVIIVVNPQEMNARQKWELNGALMAGKGVLMAVQNLTWRYVMTPEGVSVRAGRQEPQVNDLLEKYGLWVDEDILMDINHQPLTMATQTGQAVTLNLPINIVITPQAMNQEISVTAGVSALLYTWGSRLVLDEQRLAANGLETIQVMATSDTAWTLPAKPVLRRADTIKPEKTRSYPLAVLVSGVFPDAFAGEGAPPWPIDQLIEAAAETAQAEAGEQTPETGRPDQAGPVPGQEKQPGRLALIGAASLFRRGVMDQRAAVFFLNLADALSQDENLIHVRGHRVVDRSIPRTSNAARAFWKFVNLGLVSLVIAGLGLGVGLMRVKRREAYLAALKNREVKTNDEA